MNRLKGTASSFAALAAGGAAARLKWTVSPPPVPARRLPDGVSVVIPSRNGKRLLALLLPLITGAAEIIVVDNGSEDGTAEWLSSTYPHVTVHRSEQPLSFARSVNRGISTAGYSHVCLLNNDMLPEPGFFQALQQAFRRVPDLFCATAQIFFPPGKRREETGKAVMRPPPARRTTTEFPVHCIEPLQGEDLSYVLYGSGGCSLYDTSKLRAIGGIDQTYEPAYVEDLDAGVRGWQRGWPTVFVAGARTVHEHRATTSRYYSETELQRVLERNYLKFLARTVSSSELFWRLWRDAIVRLKLKAVSEHDEAAADVLAEAWRIPLRLSPSCKPAEPEHLLFALGSGDVAVFPGLAERKPQMAVVDAVDRNLTDAGQVLMMSVDELHTPAISLLEACVEIVQVRRPRTEVFDAALRQTLRKWAPARNLLRS